MGDVGLDSVLGDGQTRLEQFPTNAFGSPQLILLCHLLNQSDGFSVRFTATAGVTRFEFPKQPKALTMLAEEGVGLEDEQRIFPVLHATGEEDEPEGVGLRK